MLTEVNWVKTADRDVQWKISINCSYPLKRDKLMIPIVVSEKGPGHVLQKIPSVSLECPERGRGTCSACIHTQNVAEVSRGRAGHVLGVVGGHAQLGGEHGAQRRRQRQPHPLAAPPRHAAHHRAHQLATGYTPTMIIQLTAIQSHLLVTSIVSNVALISS